MQHLLPGSLVAIDDAEQYYYYLILTRSAFFGCQWAYAFHLTSPVEGRRPAGASEVLSTYGDGFHALIDFIEPRRTDSVVRLEKGIDVEPYLVRSNLKARIDEPGSGPRWYIYSPDFQILARQTELEDSQRGFPIASGMPCARSFSLIRKCWRIEDVVATEGAGQFPF